MPSLRIAVAVLGLIVGLLTRAPARADQPAPLRGLDDYITKAMNDWEIPGLAVAVVKDDAVVLAKGYGVRRLGESTPVDEHTLFGIGSTSKAFTAAALAMLVDEGKLKWDDPVTKYLPNFQLYDPYATREMTVRDLLCHRSGLDRYEMMWYGSAAGRDDIIRRLRYAKPNWSFRSKFGYQNMMFLVAGQIVPAVTGKSWDEFVKERIFKPLGMTTSNTSITAFHSGDDVAVPHQKIEGKVRPIPWRNIDNIGPAGSINSCVVDMAQWVRLQLNEGACVKERLLSSGAVKEMHMPQTVIRLEGTSAKLNPETHLMAYGLGWMLQDYRGKKVAQHGGAIDGMIAQVALMPEEKLGVVVLSNLTRNALPQGLMYRVFDAYLKAPERDWSGELRKVVKAAEDQEKEAEKKQQAERVKDTRPSLAPDQYAGSYKDDAYGEVKVAEEKGKLTLAFGPLAGELEPWHYDTFRLKPRDATLPKMLITFTLDSHAKVDQMKTFDPDGGEVLSFKRSAAAAAPAKAIHLTEDELKKYAGKYQLNTPPLEISIEMVGGKLKAVVPGQPVYTLVPVKADRFRIEGAPAGYFVQFEVADGQVKSLSFEQGSRPSIKLTRK